MKKQNLKSSLTVEVKDKNNQSIIEFQVPFNTKMKQVLKILWDNKIQFQTPKEKLIGFQSITQDPLQDYCLNNKIGSLRVNLSVKPLYRNTKLQGLNKYKVLKCLATGGFSKVYLVRSMQNGEFFAAKFVDKLKVSTDDKKVLIMNEKNVNQLANYEFLVKMHEFIETENFYVFIMDYCPGGQLFYLLRKVKRMSEEQARIYFLEILLGIEYLHKQGIMYRDLKPENIMIDNTGHVKVADFGLAKFCREKSYSFCGSIEYMSPEIVTNVGHSFQVDYYCLGALLYQLLVGCPPFYDPELSEYQTKKNIAYAEVQFPDNFGLSHQVKDLIEKLLVKNPLQRLGHFGGAKQIMLHPWIGKVNRAFIQSKQYDVPFPTNLNMFNFDPDEVGMSQERFTTKIENQFKLINQRRQSRNNRVSKPQKGKILCQKPKSPYAKKYSLNTKKNQKKTDQSISYLMNASTAYQTDTNFKSIAYQDLSRLSSKKKLSKNKSPSLVTLTKINNIFSKKNLPSPQNIQNKFYTLKTESSELSKIPNMSSNKLIKKKKMVTESNELFKQISNDFLKNPKNTLKNQINENLADAIQKHIKEKNMLKKSSKLKMKKLANQNGQKSFQYGKMFRETFID